MNGRPGGEAGVRLAARRGFGAAIPALVGEAAGGVDREGGGGPFHTAPLALASLLRPK